MHSSGLGGPVWIFLVVVVLLAIVLAAYVLLDSVRRFRRCAPNGRPWLLFYACLSAFYLLVVVLAQVSALPRILAVFVAVGTPLALILSFVYLLRVAFPKHPERTPVCELGNDESGDAAETPPSAGPSAPQ